MRVLLLDPDPAFLEERRRRGLDRRDEVWDGVYHVVPGPSATHQRFESALEEVLRRITTSLPLEVFHNLDLLDPVKGDENFRQPDLSVVSPTDVIERGINGHAELVVEILSPRDQTREKFPFYARCQVPEYWIVHPKSRAIEVYTLRDGAYVLIEADEAGAIHAPRFDLTLRVVDGPKLRIEWSGDSAEI